MKRDNFKEIEESWLEDIDALTGSISDTEVLVGYFIIGTYHNLDSNTARTAVCYKAFDRSSLLGNVELGKVELISDILRPVGEDIGDIEINDPDEDLGPYNEDPKLH